MKLEQLLVSNRNELYVDSRREFDTAVKNGSRVAVVRLWNNRGEGFLDALFRRIERVHEVLPIDGLVLSFNGNKEFGRASTTLDAVRFPTGFPVKVMEIVGDPSVREWTRTANGPLAYLANCLNVRMGQIWYISGDVEIDLESLRRAVPLLSMSNTVPFLSVRTEPEYLAPEGNVHYWVNQASYVLADIMDSLERPGNIEARLHQLPTYLQRVGRNTCQIWNLAHLLQSRGFDPRCNGWGGQEDTAMLIRRCRMFMDLNVPIVEYVDPNLFATDPAVKGRQQDKINAEAGAIRTIVKEYILRGNMDFLVPDFNWNI